ncbi:MAG TPA: rhomboid family intramembrane serine protease, partial [Pirellulaceae bacterium]|nr:rhomboid family intramembrane serine protease [Pirellulaceae bacterium]
MFLAVPLEFRPVAGSKSLPLANYCLIAANLLVWLIGWQWIVGRDLLGVRSGPFSILMYGFSHAGFWHLICNMWILWVFGNAVNRRLGHAYYLAAYAGSIVILGLFAWLLGGQGLIG